MEIFRDAFLGVVFCCVSGLNYEDLSDLLKQLCAFDFALVRTSRFNDLCQFKQLH